MTRGVPSMRRRVRTAAILMTVAILAGCSDATSDVDKPAADTSADAGGSDSTPECVGDGEGSITIGAGDAKLPGGSTATFGSADLEAKRPTVTFDLGQATNIERKHASRLAVGDEFGVQHGVYVVVSICAHEATIDEF